MRVLILGGTGEARALAVALDGRPDIEFESSLAGRVTNPALPVGAVRIGGFGGATGLAEHLRECGVDAVIDATHPFAATITANAAFAAHATGIPLVVLRRPGWIADPDVRWTRVPDIAAAAASVAGLTVRNVLLTTGRRDLGAFAGDGGHHYVVRTVDPPAPPMPPDMTLILDRGPYTVEGEVALMARHSVDVLVTKDSGGDMTSAKLAAARRRAIPVIMVDRPPVPTEVETVESVADALAWLVRISPGIAGG